MLRPAGGGELVPFSSSPRHGTSGRAKARPLRPIFPNSSRSSGTSWDKRTSWASQDPQRSGERSPRAPQPLPTGTAAHHWRSPMTPTTDAQIGAAVLHIQAQPRQSWRHAFVVLLCCQKIAAIAIATGSSALCQRLLGSPTHGVVWPMRWLCGLMTITLLIWGILNRSTQFALGFLHALPDCGR